MDRRELLERIATHLAYDLEVGNGGLARAFINLANAVEVRDNASEFMTDIACNQVDMLTDDLLALLQLDLLMRSQV